MLFSFVQKYSEKKGFQGNIFVLQVIFFPVKMSEEILKLLKQLRKKNLFSEEMFSQKISREMYLDTQRKKMVSLFPSLLNPLKKKFTWCHT